jgi:hypothetical protein
MFYFFAAYVVIWCGSLLWTLRGINIVSDQISSLLDAIKAIPSSDERLRLLRMIDIDLTYYPHLRRVLTLRDPWTVYPDPVANVIRVKA